jgi:hypothetical protein
MRAADRDDEGGDALQDEQPAPAGEACYAVHFEDTDCDEAGKGGREDVAGVENCDAGCYFATCIEDGEEVERASVMRCWIWELGGASGNLRVVWGFCDTEEETREEETDEIL